MALTEFSIIKEFFEPISPIKPIEVIQGIGDDCALLQMPPGHCLALSTDTLVSGVHFFPHTDPYRLGHKSLAVNLSDLAAVGAKPGWFSLVLTLPKLDGDWLRSFCQGLSDLAQQHQITLVGGDTSQGPLSITIQVHGSVKPEQALLRSKARVGDGIYVTGTLGDAGAGLAHHQQCQESQNQDFLYLLQRLEQPTPRVDIGQKLLPYASSAIDISDGLVSDLNHILNASGVGAIIDIDKLPLSSALLHSQTRTQAEQFALFAGDDYELCFTVPPDKELAMNQQLGQDCQKIGVITNQDKLLFQRDGQPAEVKGKGYAHFSH